MKRKHATVHTRNPRSTSLPNALQWMGSVTLAVPLLVAIAAVLAWGTIYEARFGTASVQRFVYRAWWFHGLLGFLAVNLTAAAVERLPWKRKHLPFVLAHIGIIFMLLGGIIGGRWGIEGQLIIPEGQAERVLLLSQNLLVVRELNPGVDHVIPTNFETRAWVHEPAATFPVPLKEGAVHVTVDRYLPNAQAEEEITGEGSDDNPAVRVVVAHEGRSAMPWLFAHDAQRFGTRWEEAHLLFLNPTSPDQLAQLLNDSPPNPKERGTVEIEFPDLKIRRELPVPSTLGKPVAIEGTPYRVTFKEVFTDLAITEQGVVNRSEQPNNPAVALLITGPEGTEPFLAFALHPDVPLFHGGTHKIPARVTYARAASAPLPPNAICLVRHPDGTLSWVLTGPAGERRIEEATPDGRLTHPWLGYEFGIEAYYPRAKVVQRFINRDNEVRAEALHLIISDDTANTQTWVTQNSPATLEVGRHALSVGYRQAQRELPVTIKLLDFRKTDYPGTQMAAGFESDVELTDSTRGLILMRTISMNNPLRYRGFTFYQASYVPGTPDTTVLAVRRDPGTPLVYAGFVIVIIGVVAMFVLQSPTKRTRGGAR
ncbi:MAG: cytochrome c biogenesis protein ResB [Candidatus Omnitrophica bacterium]|nr:cytochrome c biogenesis protein ResB [Candidatus Omnitrophota bacterium]